MRSLVVVFFVLFGTLAVRAQEEPDTMSARLERVLLKLDEANRKIDEAMRLFALKPYDREARYDAILLIDQATRLFEEVIAALAKEPDRLKQSEEMVKQLEKRREELKKIVSTDQQVVDALFAEREARDARNYWWGKIFGFGIGVGSSLVAALVWSYRRALREWFRRATK
jgi:hypothetical protein